MPWAFSCLARELTAIVAEGGTACALLLIFIALTPFRKIVGSLNRDIKAALAGPVKKIAAKTLRAQRGKGTKKIRHGLARINTVAVRKQDSRQKTDNKQPLCREQLYASFYGSFTYVDKRRRKIQQDKLYLHILKVALDLFG